jgi:hypothetical protein
MSRYEDIIAISKGICTWITVINVVLYNLNLKIYLTNDVTSINFQVSTFTALN